MILPSCFPIGQMGMFSTKRWSQLHIASRTPYRTVSWRIGSSFRQFRSFSSRRVLRGKWCKGDIARLLELRDGGKSWSAVHDAFPGRTLDALRARYTRSREWTKPKVFWTAVDHDRLLKLKADGESWRQISASFPDRTISALYTRWTRTQGGPSRKQFKWTQDEDARLLELKENGEPARKFAEEFPGRTLFAIYRRYAIIGPRGKYGRLIHTGFGGFNDLDRDEIFRLHESGKTATEIHAEFSPEKPIQMVKNVIKLGRRADEMGEKSRYRQRWTRADDKTLLRMRQKEHKMFKDISEEIGRSYLSTTNRYYKLTEGTIRPIVPHPKEYTPEENAKIVQLLKAKTPVREIAAAVGRTSIAIFHHLFSHRAEMGYLKPLRKSWRERQMVGGKVEKLRAKGMLWKEIQTYLQDYTIAQLKGFRIDAQSGAMEANTRDAKRDHSEKELQALAAKVRRLKLRGLDWPEIGLRFRQYSINRLRSLYTLANTGTDKKYSLGRPPTAGRSRSEIDIEMIGEYRAKEMTWKEIQAHMPDWSESTLQRAYGEREPRLKPIRRAEVRMIAKYKAKRMTWAEVQTHMPEYSESRLRKAYAHGRKEGFI